MKIKLTATMVLDYDPNTCGPIDETCDMIHDAIMAAVDEIDRDSIHVRIDS